MTEVHNIDELLTNKLSRMFDCDVKYTSDGDLLCYLSFSSAVPNKSERASFKVPKDMVKDTNYVKACFDSCMSSLLSRVIN